MMRNKPKTGKKKSDSMKVNQLIAEKNEEIMVLQSKVEELEETVKLLKEDLAQ